MALANKKSYSSGKKEKIGRYLCLTYMSLEDEKDGTFSVRLLPWCSEIFGTITEKLDVKTKNTAKETSLLQTWRRKAL